MVGLRLGWKGPWPGLGLGPGLPGDVFGFGSRLVDGPEGLTLLHDREVQIAIPMAEAESAVEAVLDGNPVLGANAIGLLLTDLIPDVLVADGEVVGNASSLGAGEQSLEVHVVG